MYYKSSYKERVKHICVKRIIRRKNRMASLSLKNVTKKYPNGFVAVKEFNLEIADKGIYHFRRSFRMR